MKKSIYLLTFIFLIGYNLPVKSALTNALKKMQNYGRRFTNKLKGFIPKKHYTKKSSSYDYKKEQRKIKIWEAKQKAAPYIEKFSNLIHGYGYKSNLDIFFDAFKGDKVKDIEYVLSRNSYLRLELLYMGGMGHLTPIEIAVWSKNFNIADYLLKQEYVFPDRRQAFSNPKARPNTLTIGIDFLNHYSQNNRRDITLFPNDLQCVQYLLDHGVDINQPNDSGKTALMLAAEYGQKDLVEFLLKNGADYRKTVDTKIGNTQIYGATSAVLARENGHPETAELIAKFGQEKKEEFLSAIKSGQKNLVESLIKNGADINQGFDTIIGEKKITNVSAEFVAKRSGHQEIAEWISKYKLDQKEKKRQEMQKQIIKD